MVDPLRFACLSTWGQEIKNSLGEPCAKVLKPAPKLSNKQFTNRFPPSKFLILSTGVSWQQSLLDGATVGSAVDQQWMKTVFLPS